MQQALLIADAAYVLVICMLIMSWAFFACSCQCLNLIATVHAQQIGV